MSVKSSFGAFAADVHHLVILLQNVGHVARLGCDLNYPGIQQENTGSQAEACAAVAEWEEKKARAHSMSAPAVRRVDLAGSFNSDAHPRVASGPGGGQFTASGGAQSGASANGAGSVGGKNAAANAAAIAILAKLNGMTPAQQQAYLATLSGAQMQALAGWTTRNPQPAGSKVNGGLISAAVKAHGLNPDGTLPGSGGKGGAGKSAGGKGAGGKGKGGGAKAHKAAGGKAHHKSAAKPKPKAHPPKPAHGHKPRRVKPSASSQRATPPPKPKTGTVKVSPATAAMLQRQGLLLAAQRQTLELAGPPPSVRRAMASRGHALPNGSYPIASKADVRKAVLAFGRAKPSDRAAVKKHIRKRARALGAVDLIPDGWRST